MPLVIVAHPSFEASTLAELIALARKEPGKLSYASAGPGTSQHLSMELFKLKAGVDIVHIPYKGSGPAMADLLGGHVKLMMDSTAAALGPITDKRIKALALTTARRAVVSASALMRLSVIALSAAAVLSIISLTWPPSRSAIAGPLPL